jgi:hypothetical protein
LQCAESSKWQSPAARAARLALARIGIGVRRDGVDIANTHEELRRIYRDTPWQGRWRDQLKRIAGAQEIDSTPINGVKKRAVRLPPKTHCAAPS